MRDVIEKGQQVFVYFNFRKKLFSVRGPEGRVIGHAKRIDLADVTFKVSEAGRQRVLRTRHKNVHAGIQGTVTKKRKKPKTSVSYNPYKHDSFVTASGKRVSSARRAVLKIIDHYPVVRIPRKDHQ